MAQEKIALMKELINRYDQLKFINDEHTLAIFNEYIAKLENELKEML